MGSGLEVGGVEVRVDVDSDAGDVRWEDVVIGVVGDAAECGCCRSRAGTRGVSTCLCLRDLQVRVIECSVAKSVAKLVQWLHVVMVEGAVVDKDTFRKVLLGDIGLIGLIEKISAVVFTGNGHGER